MRTFGAVVPRPLTARCARALVALLLGGAAAAATAPRAGAQEIISSETAPLRGTVVTSAGLPITGAQVTVVPASAPPRSTVTAEAGEFNFTAVQTGDVTLRVRRLGFSAESLLVKLPLAEGTNLQVSLREIPQALAAVRVTAARTDADPQTEGFEQRRRLGFGRFITREEIDRRRPLQTTDLLRTVAGIRVVGSGPREDARIRGSACPPEVVLDGMVAGAGPFDLNSVPPSDLQGVEIYMGPGAVPPQFMRAFGRAGCGTIILWTRRGERRPRAPKGRPISSEDLARLVDELQLYTAAQVDTAARLTEDFTESVRLPDSVGVARNLPGVIAEFVVDAKGKVEPGTINVVASPGAPFSAAVRTALPAASFTPAIRQGHRVRQLVQMTVQFGERKAKS